MDSFSLFKLRVKELGIILSNRDLKACSVKNEIISFFLIELTANRFSDINKLFKEISKVITEVLFEASDLGSVRNLDKAAEITEFLAVRKDREHGRIHIDTDKLLKQEKAKKALQGVKAFSAEMFVKGSVKINRNERAKIKMFIERIKKRRFTIIDSR